MYKQLITLILPCVILTACGGGGGGGGGSTPTPGGQAPAGPSAQTDFQRGIFSDESVYKDLCQSPRPATSDIQGTTTDENNWLRAWSHDLYLWYDEITDADPAAFSTPEYFDLMKTFATTPTGAPRDRFHFTEDTEEFRQLSQSGISVSYGARVTLLSAAPPRSAIIAFVEPGSPADLAGLARGDRIITIDGVDFENGNDVDTLREGLNPSDDVQSHTWVLTDFDGNNEFTVTMTAQELTRDVVPVSRIINTANGPVGYLYFTDFLQTAEARLVEVLGGFEAAGVQELVLDLRYNGGGLLDVANMLASMIAAAGGSGQVFEQSQWNDKHPTIDPVSGRSLDPSTFYAETVGFSLPRGQALPQLNLNRVFVLSTSRTSSASESVINGLLGIDFPVILIGSTTSGKPYGFYPTDNCGTTYFSIQFRGVNAKGFGDFSDGFIPTEGAIEAFEVEGCPVDDDYSTQLGDEAESMLATALGYMELGDCSATPIKLSPNNLASKTVGIDVPEASAGQILTIDDGIPGAIRSR